jgi:predicted nucleotidyltransferase
MPMDARKFILNRLEKIEQEHKVVICHAVESGSRAWGFPSKDSDYDIRFIYVHKPEWYLSVDIERKRDVIEHITEDKLFDFVGWDIRKALRLYMKSNPPLLEHLQCPIVYLEKYSLASRMRKYLPDLFSPRAGYYHYLHMAKGNYQDYLTGQDVPAKKYLYVLRPLLAVQWIKRGMGPVPVRFDQLLEGVIKDDEMKSEIKELIDRKKFEAESDSGPRMPKLHEYIDRILDEYDDNDSPGKPEVLSSEPMNAIFRDILEEIWGEYHESR